MRDHDKRYMPFGKHKGKELRKIPKRYLGYILKKCSWIDDELSSDIRAAIDGEAYPKTQEEKNDEVFNQDTQQTEVI